MLKTNLFKAVGIIWQMQLSSEIVWLPIVGVILMLTVTAISIAVFSLLSVDRRSRLTLIMAGGLSNIGYTGGAFVCYALFGAPALALANIYPLLWLPATYLLFFPLIRISESRNNPGDYKFRLSQVLDCRMLALPAVIIAILLNMANVKSPDFVTKFYIIDIFVYIASSLSFFAIGLQINFSSLRDYINLYFLLAIVKFILTPAVALLIIWLLALTGRELTDLVRKVIMVLSVTPGAVIMVTISNVFDLNGPLASALWVVTMAIFITIVVPILFLIYA